jgi:outer membrane lipoprotein SlyB
MSMKKTAIVLILIIAGVFLAGCTSAGTTGQDTVQDTIRAHYGYDESWSFGLGCYGKVSGYAYNAGNTPVENVVLYFNLVNVQSGTIRDSRSVFIGALGAGQSSTFETVLDGECTQDYRVDGTIVK